MNTLRTFWAGLALSAGIVMPQAAWSQTQLSDAWVRGTVASQTSTGAFLHITSKQGGKLVAVTSPVAGRAEIHEMKMDGDVMRMAAIDSLALPAGKMVELKPGGYHLMLLDLKQPLKDGDAVPLSLTVEHLDGTREQVTLRAGVKALGAPSAPMGHDGMKH
jgi:periplasmic copper chaperone A